MTRRVPMPWSPAAPRWRLDLTANRVTVAAVSLALAGYVYFVLSGEWSPARTVAAIAIIPGSFALAEGVAALLSRMGHGSRRWRATLAVHTAAAGAGLAILGASPFLYATVALGLLFLATTLEGGRFASLLAGWQLAVLTAAAGAAAAWGPALVGRSAILATVIIAAAGAVCLVRARVSPASAPVTSRGTPEHVPARLAPLERTDTLFLALSQRAPAVMMLLSEDGEIVYASREITTMLGVPETQANTRATLERLVPAETLADVRLAIQRAVHGTSDSVDCTFMARDGKVRYANLLFFPVEGGAGAIARDVTMERTLAQQAVRAQQMETLGTLAGGIAHDFNNLLTVILGNIHLVHRLLPEDDPNLPLLEDARLAGERGADLVRRLLDYSRPGLDLRNRVSLRALVHETAMLARTSLPSGMSLDAQEPDASAEVDGNFGALQTVLLNLLFNGRDAMPGGGQLSMRYRAVALHSPCITATGEAQPGVYHEVAVTDRGSGIEPATLNRIFDPFFTTKVPGKGTGLGLSTALSIIKEHSGLLDVETRPGNGSTFRILLPAVLAEPGEQAPAERELVAV